MNWNKLQHPESKSPQHGKRDAEHGPHEHGQGALRDPHEHEPKQSPDDLTIIEAVDEPLAGEPLAGMSTGSFYIGSVPPVRDQGTTPQCVAYSNAYDQAQHDRPEGGKFYDFWEAEFFRQIGGTSAGAYMTKGLIQRRDHGYVTVAGGGTAQYHRIASYTQLALNVTAIKDALLRGHGVLMIGDWFHSWHHPLASGKLPAPDYKTGGHAIWLRGWNDTYGFRVRNSWGTGWGLAGDCYLPYAFLTRFYAAYRATDK